MPKKRKQENRGLPPRWRYKHGAYYYRVPPGKESEWDGKKDFRLGKSLAAAHGEFSTRIGQSDRAIKTLNDIFDRYDREVIPNDLPKTARNKIYAMPYLRAVFGELPVINRTSPVQPHHIYRYQKERMKPALDADDKPIFDKKGKPVFKNIAIARQEIRTLSHVFSEAVKWGVIDRHPFKGEVKLKGEKPRDRYVEDWELAEAMSLPATRLKGSVKMIQAYLFLKLLMGLRRKDMLMLQEGDITEDGIAAETSKSGKKVVFTWTDMLRHGVQMARAARPNDNSPYLFCNERGECYVNDKGEAPGWESMWHRYMARVLKETKLEERFTDHDIRGKSGSDAESDERARQLLTHSNVSMTRRSYRRRKHEHIRPLR